MLKKKFNKFQKLLQKICDTSLFGFGIDIMSCFFRVDFLRFHYYTYFRFRWISVDTMRNYIKQYNLFELENKYLGRISAVYHTDLSTCIGLRFGRVSTESNRYVIHLFISFLGLGFFISLFRY